MLVPGHSGSGKWSLEYTAASKRFRPDDLGNFVPVTTTRLFG